MDLTVFLALAPIALFIQVHVLVRTWNHRHEVDGRLLFLLVLAGIGWLVFNTLEVLASTPASKVIFTSITFLFIAAIPVLLALFSLRLVGRWQWLNPLRISILLAPAVITVAVILTSRHHALFFGDIQFATDGPFLRMHVVYGPWFYLHALIAFALIGAGCLLMTWAYPHSHRLFRRQTVWVAAGIALPLLTSILFVLEAFPWQKDFSPIAYAVSTWACGMGISRYRLFDLRPVARDAMVDSVRDGVLVLNARGEVVDVNRAAGLIFGKEADQLIGHPVFDVVPAAWTDVLAAQKSVTAARELTIEEKGARRTFEVRTASLHADVGIDSGRLVIVQDISERRRAQEALVCANEALQRRNDELDAFASTVAHDLRNPLHAIIGFAEILRDDDDDLDRQARRECLEALHGAGQRMTGIIDALLLLARIRKEAVQPAELDMNAIVAGALASLRSMIESADAELSIPDTWPVAMGYAPWVETVWVNYLSNALKYGGPLPRIELGAAVEADAMVRFWVKDHGAGLEPGQQARLFAPFERLDRSGIDGHGLGLSIVSRVMERLGGSCGVESAGTPGNGSTFFFTLPAARAVAGRRRESHCAVQPV